MRKIYYFVMILMAMIGCSNPGSEVELVLDSKSDLGEGAIWNHETQRLYWIDITGKILNIYNPALGNNKEMMTGQMIGTVVPSARGNVIVALQNGIYAMDIQTGTKKLIVDPESDKPGNRFNDGKCDPAGRLWAGTMRQDATGNDGALYRMEGSGSVKKMIPDVGISNGIVWSADVKYMYYIDSPSQKVMRYQYDEETGEISHPEVAVEIPQEMGLPDGMSIDSEGNLWVALWGGSAVGCWNPETGKLVRKLKVPAKNVTSCAFGDSDFKTLYITTARQDMSPEELTELPLSGGLFKVRTEVAGTPAFFFKGDF